MSGFPITYYLPDSQVLSPTKRGSYISDTFHRGSYKDPEREKQLPKVSQPWGFHHLDLGEGPLISLSHTPQLPPPPLTGAGPLPCGQCLEAFYVQIGCAVSSPAPSGVYPAFVLPES